MKQSRLAVAAIATVLLAGCAKKDAAVDTTATATPPAPAPLTLASLAGTWNFRSVPEAGTDTTPTTYVVTASADSTWQLTFASGEKTTLMVTTSGDSIMMKTPVFSSQRRKGVKVMTEGVARLQDGKLVGHTIAHYQGAGKDSVLRLRTEGTKAP